MSATNSTANYNLPIFVSSDVPSWLTDWNGAMGDIDTAIAAAKATADSALLASGNNTTDITTIQGQITVLQTTVGTHTTQIGTISGNINTINSLIGNGTPTTTDQTIIGAINELHANQGDLADLTTTDKSSLVAAINEAAQGGGGGGTAASVSYDNTGSGLTATNVQDAIDELVPGSVSVNYTTSQTWAQIITALKAAATGNITVKSIIHMGAGFQNGKVLHMTGYDNKIYCATNPGSSDMRSIMIELNNAKLYDGSCTSTTYTRTDSSNDNPSADGTITLYY